MKNLTAAFLATTTLAFTLLQGCAMDTPVQAPKLHGDDEVFDFTVTVQNTSNNTALASPLSPLVWGVYADDTALFAVGQPAVSGLEKLAEDGSGEDLKNAATAAVKNMLAGPIAPGESMSFTFEAKPGQSLSFASMMVQTNDVVLAPTGAKLALFDNRNEPFSGDVALSFYDAGTEVNQEPGTGADQAPRQSAANTGAAESEAVQLLSARQDGFTYPAASDMYKVTITVADHDHEGEDHDHEGEDHDHEGEDHDHDEDK